MPDYTEHYNLKKPKKTENYDINDVTRDNADLIDKALYEKVDKLPGKGLSTNDFTDNYKKKVDSLKNYDDTGVKEDINTNTARITKLEQKKDMLSQQMPWNTTSGESIHIQDASEWDENKLSLSGNMKQEKRSGKNYFNLNDKKSVDDLCTVDTNDWISVTYNNTSGTSVKYVNYKTNSSSKIKANTNYALFLEVKSVSGTGSIYIVSDGVTEEKSQFSVDTSINFSNLSNNKIYKYTITSRADLTDTAITTMLRSFVRFNTGQSGSITFRISVLEDTTVTVDNFEYEKYGAMPSTEFPSMPVVATGVQKIRQFGKNVCKITSVTGYNYISSIPTKPGKITINFDGNSMSIKSTENAYRIALTNIIQLLPNTKYTLSYTRTNNLADGGSARRYIYDYSEKDGYTLINALNSGDDGKMSYTFTTGESGAIALAWGYNNTASGSSSVIYDIQIEKGSVATGYEPYSEEINTLNLGSTELCAIVDANGTVVAQDSLEAKNGKWYIHPKVVKINAKNYVWNIITVAEGNLFRASLTKLNTIKKVSHIVVCNYFKGIIGSAGRADGNIYYNTGSNSIDIICNDFSTIEEFNNFITENDLIIYALANDETLKEITDTSLTTVLDKLYNNFKLQKGTNNVIVESENGVGVNMELTYMQDLQTKLNLLEAMCVSNASQEV